jgi:Protein of unknown function (DUF3311)
MRLSYALTALPFVGVLVGIFFVNTVEPYVLGLPFALFWLVLWVVLTAAIMAIVGALDHHRDR